jgi:adenosine deaminase
MRPDTLAQLAVREGVPVAESVDAWSTFDAFRDSTLAAKAVLRRPEDLSRLAQEAVEDAAADGAWWIELQTTISSYSSVVGGDEATLELLLEAVRMAANRVGIGAGLVIAADREAPPEVAVRRAQLAVRYADAGVVGFGLGGDERYPPEPFAAAFEIAANAGLLRVPHAGELAGPQSVRGALDILGADRVQHGVRAVEDPILVERLASDGVCLDVCLTSNRALGVIQDISLHPLPQLLEAGVACSLNADGTLVFGTTLAGEYERARTALGLRDDALAHIARTSILASGAPQALRQSALQEIDRWLASSS